MVLMGAICFAANLFFLLSPGIKNSIFFQKHELKLEAALVIIDILFCCAYIGCLIA